MKAARLRKVVNIRKQNWSSGICDEAIVVAIVRVVAGRVTGLGLRRDGEYVGAVAEGDDDEDQLENPEGDEDPEEVGHVHGGGELCCGLLPEERLFCNTRGKLQSQF